MFEAKQVNPARRDLLRQLAAIGALGALGASGAGISVRAQSGAAFALSLPATRRGEPGYDSLRETSLWRSNMPDRYPDLIVEASSVDDLQQALDFARQNDLQVVCRAGGHNTAGAPLRNGGMMIYVNRMNAIEVDADARTVSVEPGITMAGLYGGVSRYGLDFPTADCSTVGLAGFILGGGFGRNCMHLTNGPVCNALLSAEVVLASGEVVTASEDSHADLFRAMRGCGPAFFGIVTRMKLRLFDPPGAYMSSTYRFPFDALASLVDFFDEHEARQDSRVSNRISLGPDPNDASDSIVTARVTAFADAGSSAQAEARELLAYYADAGLGAGATEQNEFVEQNVSAYMMTTDPTAGTHTDNVFTDDASSLPAAAHLMRARPDGFSIHLDLAHNMQYHAPYGDHIAFSAAGRHFLSTYVDWSDATPERNALAYEWADRFTSIAGEYGAGNYLNQVDTALYPDKVRQSFSDASWERLSRVRRQYDPDGRFFSYVGMAGTN